MNIFIPAARAGTALLLLTACVSPSGRAEPKGSPVATELSRAAPPVEVELEPYFRELKTIDVVSGGDTLRFLLDTGGGHTLITPEVARKLGCTPFGRTVGHRMSGQAVTFQWCREIGLSLGGVALPSAYTAVFDLASVLPSELPRLDGLLGLKSFSGRAVTVDLGGGRLVIETDSSAAARKMTMAPLQARTATGEDGTSVTAFLAADGEPAPIWLLLDSGNLLGTILSPHAGQLLPQNRSALEEPSGPDTVPLRIIGLRTSQEPVVVREIIYDGVLGARFFLDHVLMFDFRITPVWIGAERRAQ